MSSPWRLENIQRMRDEAGIDDPELHEQIARLTVGDIVHLTVLGPRAGRSSGVIDVRIQEIRGAKYAGLVIHAPPCGTEFDGLVDQHITFSEQHIHSVQSHNGRATAESAIP